MVISTSHLFARIYTCACTAHVPRVSQVKNIFFLDKSATLGYHFDLLVKAHLRVQLILVFRACDVFHIATKFRIYLYVYKCDQFTEYLRRAFPEIYRAFGLGVHMYHIPPCAAALALPC